MNTDQFGGYSTGAPEFVDVGVYRYESGSSVGSDTYSVPAFSGTIPLNTIPDFVDATYLIQVETAFDDGTFVSLGFVIVVEAGVFRVLSPLGEGSFADYNFPNFTYNIDVQSDGFSYQSNFVGVTGFDPNTGNPVISVLSTETSDSVEIQPATFSFDGFTQRGFFGGFLFDLELTEFPDLPSSMEGFDSPVYLGTQWIACD